MQYDNDIDLIDNDIDISATYDYAEWSARSLVADLLRKIGYAQLANITLIPGIDVKILKDCVTLLNREAQERKDYALSDRLAHAGLLG